MKTDNNIIKKLRIDWNKVDENSYLRDIPTIAKLSELEFDNNITFFVGENGSGKSTLLEAIAIAYGFNPEGGTINFNFSTYEDTSDLYMAVKLSKGLNKYKFGYFFRAESFFNVATKAIDYDDRNFYHSRSHGESFLQFFQNYNKAGIYILDEPEAALSPQKQLTLIYEIIKMAEIGAQFIIVTHSPILLGIPDSEIYSFDNEEIHKCNWEDTKSYQIIKSFINNRNTILKELFKD